jgi:hypothetical protein
VYLRTTIDFWRAVAGRRALSILRSVTALAGYLVGAGIAGWMAAFTNGAPSARWLGISFAIESRGCSWVIGSMGNSGWRSVDCYNCSCDRDRDRNNTVRRLGCPICPRRISRWVLSPAGHADNTSSEYTSVHRICSWPKSDQRPASEDGDEPVKAVRAPTGYQQNSLYATGRGRAVRRKKAET